MNDSFGLPPVEAAVEPQDEKTRIAALRAKAEAQVAAEFDDDAVLAKFLAEARAKKLAKIDSKEDVQFATDTQGFPEKYVRISIYPGMNKDDPQYVPLGINGFVIKAPRDEEIIVPEIFVTECLDHAIEERTVKFQGGIVTRPAPRFPYQKLGSATKEEYQAYQQSQRAKAERQLAAVA